MSGFLGGILDAIGINTTPRGMLDAPVGTSTMQRVTNASPDFSPMISPGLLSNEQRLGAFWNLATRRAKPWTNRDLPQLSEAANEAYDAAGGFVGMSTPIRAYHGSPHTFDRFDLSKIGTGEGAQAYGHGLYFAGNEKVAKGYRDKLTQFDPFNVDPAVVAANAIRTSGSKPKAIGFLENRIAQLKADFGAAHPMIAQDEAALTALRSGNVASKPPGSMYEVNLRTSPERLLDWDKPLSQQPAAVREAVMSDPAIARSLDAQSRILGPQIADKISGQGAYAAATGWRRGVDLSPPVDAARAAADRLRAAGIDGIQYLDGGSRAAGDGTRNYVMFRDDIIDILKRYGLLGMIGGGAAAVGAPEQ